MNQQGYWPLKRIRVAISGIQGRMGRVLAVLAQADPNLALTAGIVKSLRPDDDKNFYTTFAETAMTKADVLVDFSTPEATLKHLKQIQNLHKAAVVGTTGFDAAGFKAITGLARNFPIVLDSNFSWGIAMMRRWLKAAGRYPDGIDAGICEIHRSGKKDAPSGTAKDLAGLLKEAGQKPQVVSLRLGEVRGEHRVYFAGSHEILQISHQVYSRETFAAGALHAAQWARGRKPGLYRYSDVTDSY